MMLFQPLLCRIQLQYAPGSDASVNSVQVECDSRQSLPSDAQSDEHVDDQVESQLTLDDEHSTSRPGLRARPYRKISRPVRLDPLDSLAPKPRQAIYQVRKADERRFLLCCNTCHFRRIHEVSPGAIKWYLSEDTVQEHPLPGELA